MDDITLYAIIGGMVSQVPPEAFADEVGGSLDMKGVTLEQLMAEVEGTSGLWLTDKPKGWLKHVYAFIGDKPCQ